MNKVWLVAKWEFMRNFKWKQELIGYAIMLAIYLVIFAVQAWNESSQQNTIQIGVSGIEITEALPEKFVQTQLDADLNIDNIFATMESQALDAVLQRSDEQSFTLYALQQSKWHSELRQSLHDYYQAQKLDAMSLSQQQLDDLLNPVELEIINKAEEDKGGSTQFLGLMAAILSAVAVFTSFGLCLTSVTQEKQQRVTEQLLTCLSHQQWVDGKALGLCLASLKSVFTTVLFAVVVIFGVAAFTGKDDMAVGVSFILILQVLLFSILGIGLWNYVFVGFSATIDDINHSGKTGVMFLPMVPVILVFFVLDDPGGQVASVLSIFPFTSIGFMPMRLASMDVPVWQTAMSLVLLLVALMYVRKFAFRIFRANITLFGKEPGWGEIWRSMRQPD